MALVAKQNRRQINRQPIKCLQKNIQKHTNCNPANFEYPKTHTIQIFIRCYFQWLLFRKISHLALPKDTIKWFQKGWDTNATHMWVIYGRNNGERKNLNMIVIRNRSTNVSCKFVPRKLTTDWVLSTDFFRMDNAYTYQLSTHVLRVFRLLVFLDATLFTHADMFRVPKSEQNMQLNKL